MSTGAMKAGEDYVVMIGCYTMETLAMWVACLSLGIAVAVSVSYTIYFLICDFSQPSCLLAFSNLRESILQIHLCMYRYGSSSLEVFELTYCLTHRMGC